MAVDPTPVTAIARAIDGVARAVAEWLKTREARRMRAAIQAAENYIRANEGEGRFSGIPDKRKDKLLAHYRKRFFKLN